MSGKTRQRVYCLYTGGTIGMAGHPLSPLPIAEFSNLIAEQPGFTKSTLTVEMDNDMPSVIEYTLEGITPPLDSSSMTPTDWITIAERILDNYDEYDGFVVLHGTDTMAFTASALGFLLSGQTKPVVVTGSQIPLSKTRNDALRNMISSMVVAATHREVVESTLLFDAQLLRGNRSQKVNASEFPAFTAPNFKPLGSNGISIDINQGLLLAPPKPGQGLDLPANRSRRSAGFRVWKQAYSQFSILSLILFPGIQASTVKAMLTQTTPPVRGVVIQAFGSGNAPANNALIAALKAAHDNGAVLVDVTQVLRGSVDLDAYQSASGLKNAGSVSGYDMTPEAALAKLIYLTGQGYDQKTIEAEMRKDLRGELSVTIRDKVEALWSMLAETRPTYSQPD